MGTSLHATPVLNMVECTLEKCLLSAMNVGKSIPKLAKLHLAPKNSHQKKILGRKQMGKGLQPKVSSDWRCEVRIMYFGVCFLSCRVKTHIHKTCHLKNFSVQLSIVKYILTVMQSSSSSCKNATLYPLNNKCSSPPPSSGNHYFYSLCL